MCFHPMTLRDFLETDLKEKEELEAVGPCCRMARMSFKEACEITL